jgi:hypothetical protein
MERIVRIVTKNLVSRLPSEQEFYRPDQLRALKFPEFIVERIIKEMERNIDDTITLPYTEWVDIKNNQVRDAWREFIDVIRSEARFPNAYAPSVIEAAVSDSLEMLLQPRKKIPLLIFGPERALDRETLEERSESIVVYKHLAIAPVKYLHKKKLEAISFEQYSRIIEMVDEKIISRYNALSWTQLLEPLFLLLGDSIDTNLLRIFFQDKQKPRIARMFDEMSSSISRAGLIEALSSPELLDSVTDPDPRDIAYREERTVKKRKNSSMNQTGKADQASGLSLTNISKTDDSDDEDIPLHSRFIFDENANEDFDDPAGDTLSFNEMFTHLDDAEDEQGDAADDIIANRFSPESDVHEDALDEPVEKDRDLKTVEYTDLPAELNENEDENEQERVIASDSEDVETFEIDEDLVRKFEKLSKSRSETEPASETSELSDHEELKEETGSDVIDADDEEKKDTYIWKHFLSDVYEDGEMDQDEYDDDSDTDYPFMHMNAEDDQEQTDEVPDEPQPDLISLKAWMRDEEKRFVNEIFRGSEKAYEQAVEEISVIDEWKQATRYIEKEIFARNKVDLYDEIAVDFTDKLHSYFMELYSKKAEH